MFALQIIGKKKSGKTTTMLRFIKAAVVENLKVAAFKHTHHTVSMDVAGTDTFRFAEAGAEQVLMQNNKGFFLHEQRLMKQEVTLEDEIVRFVKEDIDGLLIEGFKQQQFPKLVLLRPNDKTTDFQLDNIQYVGTIYPEMVQEGVLDLTTEEKAIIWFKTYLAAQDTNRLQYQTYHKVSATAKLTMHPETLKKIKKEDLLVETRVFSMIAAKKIGYLTALSDVDILFKDNEKDTITIEVTVKPISMNIVDIQALAVCQLTALTLFDKCKEIDNKMIITDCYLLTEKNS